jgi:two-component sensor histidine kinase
VNELITNSAKYSSLNGSCEAWIEVTQTESKISVSVRDQGVGLSPDFNATSQKGLGMRLINAFTKQLSGNLEIRRHDPGVEFILVFPKPPQPPT